MIARKSAFIIIIQIINGIMGYIGLKYVALYMEPWQYGVVGFAWGFVSLFAIFGKLGFDQAHIKKISEGKEYSNCIGTFISIKILLTIVLSSVTLLFLFIWKNILGRGFETAFHEPAILILLCYFILNTLSQSMISTFRARKEAAKAQIPLLFYTFFRITATMVVAYFDYGVIELAFTYLFGEIFQFGFAFYLFRKYPVKKPSLSYMTDYLKFAFPMAIATSAVVIMTNIDKVIIQLFWGAQQVGEYFAIFNLSRYIILFSSSVGLLLFPTISELHSKNEMNKIKELTLISERYISMIIFPVVCMMIALAEPILHIILSDRYMPALNILYILPIFTLMAVLIVPYTQGLVGMNHPKINRNRVIIMMICNVFLNILLVPKDINMFNIKLFGFGAFGAAIATVISYIIGLVYVRYMYWKISGIFGNIKVILHAVSASILGLLLIFLQNSYTISRWYQLVLVVFIGFVIYFMILAVLREFTKDDFVFFIDTLNIKKMIRYIKDEIRLR